MRSSAELKELILNLKSWAAKELEVDFTYEEFCEALEKRRQMTYEKFLSSRISHLPASDLINLIRLLKEKKKK